MLTTASLTLGLGFYLSQYFYDVPQYGIKAWDTPFGTTYYVGAALSPSEFLPGLLEPFESIVNYTHNGQAQVTDFLMYLTTQPPCTYTWLGGQNGQVPINAVQLGGNDKESFYVGRLVVDNGAFVSVGKIVPSLGLLVYPNGAAENTSSTYDVLTIDCPQEENFSPGTTMYLSQSENDLPENAVLAGVNVNRSAVYVGAAHDRFTVLPGGIVPDDNLVYFADGSLQYTEWMKIYLTVDAGYKEVWVADSNGHVPENAVKLGMDYGRYDVYYVGRTKGAFGEDCVGKIRDGDVEITFPSNGTEMSASSYEVLTVTRRIQLSAQTSVYYSTGPRDVPVDAVAIGDSLYVGYAEHQGETAPALIDIPGKLLHYSFNGAEQISQRFAFLTGTNLTWTASSNGQVPTNGVKLGKTSSGVDYYVGRVTVETKSYTCKISTTNKVCYYPRNGAEFSATTYEALVVRT